MTLPERLERLWAKWPEARPVNMNDQPLSDTSDGWWWDRNGDWAACACDPTLAESAIESALFDELARREWIGTNSPNLHIGKSPIWHAHTIYSELRPWLNGSGPTRLDALLALAEKIAGIE